MDVLIIGGRLNSHILFLYNLIETLTAGPVGLTTAASLVRQGVTVRILDRSPNPLIVGRADSLQPRTMEVFQQLGLGPEAFALGPRLEHTVVYKDGKMEIFVESHQSPPTEGRFQGLYDATQTEVEHLLIRFVSTFTPGDSYILIYLPLQRSDPPRCTCRETLHCNLLHLR